MTNPQVSDAIEAMAGAIVNGDWDELPDLHKVLALAQARKALAAYHEWLEASGWAVVPVEATAEMHDEGCDRMLDPIGLYDAYRAMIAARPRVEG